MEFIMNSMEITYRKQFIASSLGHLETLRKMDRFNGKLFATLRHSIRASIRVIRRLETA